MRIASRPRCTIPNEGSIYFPWGEYSIEKATESLLFHPATHFSPMFSAFIIFCSLRSSLAGNFSNLGGRSVWVRSERSKGLVASLGRSAAIVFFPPTRGAPPLRARPFGADRRNRNRNIRLRATEERREDSGEDLCGGVRLEIEGAGVGENLGEVNGRKHGCEASAVEMGKPH